MPRNFRFPSTGSSNKEKDENIWRANMEGSHERSWKVKKRVLKVKDITLSFDLKSCRV